MHVDDAWYSGDRDRLAAVNARQERRPDGRRRLWSRRPEAPLRPETRMHIPLAADIASTSASLLFSEPPTLTGTDPGAQQRLDHFAGAGGIANTLIEAAEVAAALGGVYLRITWDRELVDRPLLTIVHADCALPEFRFGLLRAVTFWHELPSDSATVWRHLERHEPGAITHALYQGTADRLGVRVPLTDHPDVADLADSLGETGDTIETGLPDALTAAYVPNIKPNRRHRGSPLGRSDFQDPIHDLCRRARHRVVELDARHTARPRAPDRACRVPARQRPRHPAPRSTPTGKSGRRWRSRPPKPGTGSRCLSSPSGWPSTSRPPRPSCGTLSSPRATARKPSASATARP
ncbi:hypothetical protein [Streptomyces sp. XD-27]|uniref:hypothetical protein n=1 Tax=Streptomyces sp. XD-27 TaxID=3062779 RepID=UPI0026F42D58|nr:hypothetical protein [Streptomyces sp. XD-27]WKX73819.1 hypothetical protein Q3Y56_31630 [Streptomyces sp. XD-27]